jgi:hypothetical protein
MCNWYRRDRFHVYLAPCPATMTLQRKSLTQEDKLLYIGKHSLSEFNFKLPALFVILMQVTAEVDFRTYTKVGDTAY